MLYVQCVCRCNVRLSYSTTNAGSTGRGFHYYCSIYPPILYMHPYSTYIHTVRLLTVHPVQIVIPSGLRDKIADPAASVGSVPELRLPRMALAWRLSWGSSHLIYGAMLYGLSCGRPFHTRNASCFCVLLHVGSGRTRDLAAGEGRAELGWAGCIHPASSHPTLPASACSYLTMRGTLRGTLLCKVSPSGFLVHRAAELGTAHAATCNKNYIRRLLPPIGTIMVIGIVPTRAGTNLFSAQMSDEREPSPYLKGITRKRPILDIDSGRGRHVIETHVR